MLFIKRSLIVRENNTAMLYRDYLFKKPLKGKMDFLRVGNNKNFNVLAISLAVSILGISELKASPLLTPYVSLQSQTIPTSNAWFEIDAKKFEQNLTNLKLHLNGKSQICAVLKGDAYGHGLGLLMPSIIKMQIPCVGVTSNSEIALVRKSGYNGRIMRLRAATDDEIFNVASLNVEELIGNLEQAQRISKWAKEQNQTIRYSLSLNSGGMNRNGIEMQSPQGKEDAVAITKLPNLKIVGIMTHYAVEDVNYVRTRYKRFQEESSWLIKTARLNRKELTLHTANSFTTLKVPEAHADMVRAGYLLFGWAPDNAPFNTIMSFKTRVTEVNSYLKGTTVGYDQTFELKRDSKLANLPIGYSDGYPSILGNVGHVLVRGHKVPIVGKVMMNTMMVDVTDYPDILAGDEVVLLGEQKGSEIKISELEQQTKQEMLNLWMQWSHSSPKTLAN